MGASSDKSLFDGVFDLGNLEGLPRHLVQGLGVQKELVAQNGLELAGVHFRNQDALVAAQQRAEVARQRPEVADVNVTDVGTLGTGAPYALLDRSEGRPPAHHRELAAGRPERDILLGNMV